MSLNSCWQFGHILTLRSKDRICSFNWIRGSKHCFLTSFSNLYHYILFLIFFARLLLTSFFAPFSAARESNFSFRFVYLWFSDYHVVHAPPFFWHTWRIFLKEDARGNLVQGLVLVLFPRSAFCQRIIMQMPVRQSQIIPFLLTYYPWTDTFLRDISLR